MEKTEYIEILIQKITYICREKNISPHMLGKESGVGKDFLANINKGSLPSCDKLAKVADYCDVSVDYLLGREHASSGSVNNYSHIHDIGENTTIGQNIGHSCDVSEDAVEMDKVLRSLGHKDRINVISAFYDIVDNLKKELTQHLININLKQNFSTIGHDIILNVTPENDSIYLTSIKVNLFNSIQGVHIYRTLTFFILIAWIICFMVTPMSAFISFSVIPFIFFLMGSSYFKSNKDKYHLKIHKILIGTIIFTMVFLFLFVLIYMMIKINIKFAMTIIISINILDSYGLFFNSLGEDNIIDFIISICKKLNGLISKS